MSMMKSAFSNFSENFFETIWKDIRKDIQKDIRKDIRKDITWANSYFSVIVNLNTLNYCYVSGSVRFSARYFSLCTYETQVPREAP